jgi:hypothetical protein
LNSVEEPAVLTNVNPTDHLTVQKVFILQMAWKTVRDSRTIVGAFHLSVIARPGLAPFTQDSQVPASKWSFAQAQTSAGKAASRNF